jgi:hypothetical protein
MHGSGVKLYCAGSCFVDGLLLPVCPSSPPPWAIVLAVMQCGQCVIAVACPSLESISCIRRQLQVSVLCCRANLCGVRPA